MKKHNLKCYIIQVNNYFKLLKLIIFLKLIFIVKIAVNNKKFK